MHLSIASLAVAALSAIVSAQDLSSIPACASSCVGNSLSTTGCGNFNIACICASKEWIAGLSCCVSQSCSPADQQATINFAVQLCGTVQVQVPTVASCASTASPTSAPTGGSNSTANNSTVAASPTPTTTGSGSSPASKGGAAAAYSQYIGSGLGLAAAGLIAAVL